MFNGENTDEKEKGKTGNPSPRSKAHQLSSSAYTSPAQAREMREQRKDKFLTEFNSSPRCALLKAKLKKAVLRVAVEKYHKTAPSSGLTQA
jgi:hypothetical protein